MLTFANNVWLETELDTRRSVLVEDLRLLGRGKPGVGWEHAPLLLQTPFTIIGVTADVYNQSFGKKDRSEEYWFAYYMLDGIDPRDFLDLCHAVLTEPVQPSDDLKLDDLGCYRVADHTVWQ